ncbi:MAG TPA: hypothetical protein VEC94_08145 [Pseudolabrys sp.]|nr:hypothetical protein [Pseudolabrys sp.]
MLTLAALFTASAARAEIEKFMQQCSGKLCAQFRASIAIPDGWSEDKEASNYFNGQMLLPKGLDFEKAPAKIYVVVRYNRNRQPVSDFLPDSIKDWKSRAKHAKISKLDDLARGEKPPFVRHAFESGGLKEQGYELQAVTTDGDRDGNQFVVTITLSANSKAALRTAEPAYLAILSKY